MAKVTFDEKLVVERFPDQKDRIGPIFDVINNLAAQVAGGMKGRLTFSDNFLGLEKEFDFTYQSATVSLPQKLTWTLNSPPKSLTVVQATQDGVEIIILVAWRLVENSQIYITQMWRVIDTRDDDEVLVGARLDELRAASRYKIRIRVTP